MAVYKVAAIQMDSQNNKSENLQFVTESVREAAAAGATLIAFPEVMNGLDESPDFAESEQGETTSLLKTLAKQYHVWIHGGSISTQNPKGPRTYNTSLLLSPTGDIVARYDKLHNFDVTLPNGTGVQESANKEPGSDIVTVSTPLGKIGLAICYDLRFPELFRLMALEGAQVIILPANFTAATGRYHWEPLLRSRAIENGCYIIAPNQVGTKAQFEAYGHSMIIDPWGNVLAAAQDRPTIIYADIDLDFLKTVRTKIPSLQNRRTDVYTLQEVHHG